MLDAFRLGGWGMYPTTIAGLVLLAVAVQYARHPDAARQRVVRSLSLLVFLTSCLGFTTGVINAFTNAAPEAGADLGLIVVIGVGESLVNMGLGLCVLVLSTIITTFGAARARGGDADLVIPSV